MSYIPSYLRYALLDGDVKHLDKDQEIVFKRLKVADLVVSDSSIIACDPLVDAETRPFTQRVPSGIFPVFLSIASVKTDQRIAFATLLFLDCPVTRWEMALLPEQDPGKLGSDGFFGYSVDSGTGCFMTSSTAKLLLDRMDRENEYYEVLIKELDKTYRPTWSWADVNLSDTKKSNLILFSTGWGDGLYASYFGFGENEVPVCVVTDFGIIYEEQK